MIYHNLTLYKSKNYSSLYALLLVIILDYWIYKLINVLGLLIKSLYSIQNKMNLKCVTYSRYSTSLPIYTIVL